MSKNLKVMALVILSLIFGAAMAHYQLPFHYIFYALIPILLLSMTFKSKFTISRSIKGEAAPRESATFEFGIGGGNSAGETSSDKKIS